MNRLCKINNLIMELRYIVFSLLWCIPAIVTPVVCVDLGSRLNVLEQKFSLQSYEFSLLRQELNEERAQRVRLEAHLENPTSKVLPQEKIVVKDTDQRTTEKPNSALQNVLRAFKEEKAQRIALEKEVTKLKETESAKYSSLSLQLAKETAARLELENEYKIVKQENNNKWKQTQKNMTNIEHRLASMEDEQKHMTNVVIPENCETLKSDIKEMKDESTIKINRLSTDYTKLYDNHQNFQITINKLQDYNSKSRVSFSSRLSVNIADIAPWNTVVFNKVLTNHGNCYSRTNGEFTTTTAGTYVFYTHIVGAHNRGLEISLQMNGKNMMFLYVNGPSHGTDGNMAVLKLKKGDKVKIVKHGPWGGKPFYIHNTWSTFSGFLIFPE